jgi:hypothetical protein
MVLVTDASTPWGRERGGFGISDTRISGILSGHYRREFHAKAKT